MQKVFKKFHPARYGAAVLIASILFGACTNEEKKASETVEVKKDSLPPIDHDSLIKHKPETIIIKPGS